MVLKCPFRMWLDAAVVRQEPVNTRVVRYTSISLLIQLHHRVLTVGGQSTQPGNALLSVFLLKVFGPVTADDGLIGAYAALCNNVIQHVSTDVGELAQAAGMLITKLVVIQAHEVQNRGVDIPDGDALFVDRTQPEFIGFTD